MLSDSLSRQLPPQLLDVFAKENIQTLRPAQQKAVDAGLLDGKSLLICTPTASGKTLIAELASLFAILQHKGKTMYIVPLRSLATEKHREFQRKYNHLAQVTLSIGDMDSDEPELADSDIIICTAEKFDSLLRHRVSWLKDIAVLIFDEIHLLNDPSRGPVLELLITLLKTIVPKAQLLGLSATIGNPQALADWLGASLILDDWRPVPLHKGVFVQKHIKFVEDASS